jgi:4a-hydroxytetrahydrobiopterin dehydratase
MAETLVEKVCTPCRGGVPPLTREEAERYLGQVPGWELADDARLLRRTFRLANFREALAFVHGVGELAEAEGHHPDLHLTGYRTVTIEMWTHAVGGLTENDFILAAKIDQVPVEEKR